MQTAINMPRFRYEGIPRMWYSPPETATCRPLYGTIIPEQFVVKAFICHVTGAFLARIPCANVIEAVMGFEYRIYNVTRHLQYLAYAFVNLFD